MRWLGEEERVSQEGRLTKPHQYALVYNRGKTWVTSLMVMRALPNGLALSRFGFSVSRHVGKAVIRNKVKRLLREVSRVQPVKQGWDIVLIARPAATSADYASIKETEEGLLARAGLLESSNMKYDAQATDNRNEDTGKDTD